MATKEKTRKEELFEKLGSGKATSAEMNEFATLLQQEARANEAQELTDAVEKVKAFITDNGWNMAQVLKALSDTPTEKIFFNVPYTDEKGKDKKYLWFKGKKTVGVSSKYYKKLINAELDIKKKWATPDGLAWLETDEGKRWAAKAE